MDDDDEYGPIARELGMFLRRWWRMSDKRADSSGLDRAGFVLLSRINTDGPARLSRLAGDMCVDLSVISRQVAALEAAGLVKREHDPTDRRASVITVTDLGADFFNRKREHFRALLRSLLADWTPAERAEFARLMGRFNGAMAAHDEGK